MSPPQSNAEEALINRAKAGDEDAVTQLYELNVDKIFRYVAYRVPDSDAEDITADIFVNMVKSLPQFTYTGAPFESWLYRIANARVVDFYRKNNKKQYVELDDRMSADLPKPEDSLILNQEQHELRQKLKQLSDEQQTLLLLRFVERKSHEEVATIMNKSVGAVKTMQHRALQKLAELMGKEKKERHYLRGRHD